MASGSLSRQAGTGVWAQLRPTDPYEQSGTALWGLQLELKNASLYPLPLRGTGEASGVMGGYEGDRWSWGRGAAIVGIASEPEAPWQKPLGWCRGGQVMAVQSALAGAGASEVCHRADPKGVLSARLIQPCASTQNIPGDLPCAGHVSWECGLNPHIRVQWASAQGDHNLIKDNTPRFGRGCAPSTGGNPTVQDSLTPRCCNLSVKLERAWQT